MGIRLEPSENNPLTFREQLRRAISFDIKDTAAGQKIGYVVGYLGGPWAEGREEFRVTHIEISEPGRQFAPSDGKDLLRGLREHLPDSEFVSAGRYGEGGGLSPAEEKMFSLRDLPRRSDMDMDK